MKGRTVRRVNLDLAMFLSVAILAASVAFAEDGGTSIGARGDHVYRIENGALARDLSIEGGTLRTTRILNKLAKTEGVPSACSEFCLRVSEGTHTTGTDVVLTSADFVFQVCREYTPRTDAAARGIVFLLENQDRELTVAVHYELAPSDFYLRKYLIVTSGKPITLERIDVDCLAMSDAQQPYQIGAMYARGKWSPGLGQPLYTTESGTFWGVEFPAATNWVKDATIHSGYLWGREIGARQAYRTYSAVLGVADEPRFITDAFFDYIARVRVRPLRLQIQYNTWFDTGRGVNKESFRKSVELIHEKLVVERGNKPLRAYVVDDGWQDTQQDWTDKTWKVNGKFDEDFSHSLETVRQADSSLGLWLSPGCLFGAHSMVAKYREAGFEALDDWMSLAGPKYMGLLEERMVELTRQGVCYFKLDGLFGHLNLRNFDLHGERYGLPHMPQLELEGLKAGDAELNEAKYDELKTYYLVAGTERLMTIFERMGETNPDVYIVISNGAYLSPWWLMYVDSIWMINAGDAAGGSDRTAELVYRDDRYHEIWQQENTQFPIHAVFNHEPKKRKTGEPKDVFRKYLYMNLSRGTGFIELYIKPGVLKDYDWDVISEGLHWAQEVFPVFKRSRMHGGSPKAGEVYGYTAWAEDQGYVSVHNPAAAEQEYAFNLDRAFGLMPDSGKFHLSSPIEGSLTGLKGEYDYGDRITLRLEPREIRILNFDKTVRDWSLIQELQNRNEGPPPLKVVPIDDHPLLGIWHYTHGGVPHSREFLRDGTCTLRAGDEIQWRKPFSAVDEKTLMVEGRYRHILLDDGTLGIEGRYTAERE
jgi:hypothetical protein